MEKTYLLPASILLAGAMIGAGLFFGLRGRPIENPKSSILLSEAPTPKTPSIPDPSPPEPTPTPPPAALDPSDLQAKVQKQAIEALDKHRARIIADCWNPSVKKAPNPTSSNFTFRFLFNPKGHVDTSGVADPAAESRHDVSQCIRDLKLPITITPPGSEIAVQVQLTLP